MFCQVRLPYTAERSSSRSPRRVVWTAAGGPTEETEDVAFTPGRNGRAPAAGGCVGDNTPTLAAGHQNGKKL